ncbi:MAG TPA: DNA gyrase inhibitor YacG [Terriglobales bacterium]|jgi:endogenous inhibitor of DNA gyrase (YacG/DUF329 family)|nr:DNA gyrase inhibitor YacG [Terriglobales bacterium]
MAGNKDLKLKCPICKKEVLRTDPEFPFCSERCRTIDLGRWASGAYVIASTPQDTSDATPDSIRDPDNEE